MMNQLGKLFLQVHEHTLPQGQPTSDPHISKLLSLKRSSPGELTCCVGSGYFPILAVILFPMPLFSANHFPPMPATGCQPISTNLSSASTLASPGGMAFGFAPRPRECCSAILPLTSCSLERTLPLLHPSCLTDHHVKVK